MWEANSGFFWALSLGPRNLDSIKFWYDLVSANGTEIAQNVPKYMENRKFSMKSVIDQVLLNFYRFSDILRTKLVYATQHLDTLRPHSVVTNDV